MHRSTILDFTPAETAIDAAVSKFGGPPVWLEDPVTPLSRRTGEPMTFIGQIVVPREVLDDGVFRMAYLFMTGAGFDYRAMETWSPAEGETCVVVQRGAPNTARAAPYPSLLTRWEERDDRRVEVACEYAVVSTAAVEEAYRTWSELAAVPDAERDRISNSWRGNKIGGAPCWVQDEEYPFEDSRLLLQLECSSYPFNLNLGGGVGYAFIDAAGARGTLLWQC